MKFGGDADVGMLQDVSMLRIERGSATSALAPEADILLQHNICRAGANNGLSTAAMTKCVLIPAGRRPSARHSIFVGRRHRETSAVSS